MCCRKHPKPNTTKRYFPVCYIRCQILSTLLPFVLLQWLGIIHVFGCSVHASLGSLCYSHMFSFDVIVLARVLPFLLAVELHTLMLVPYTPNLVKIIYNPIWCWGPTELSDLCSASVEDQTCDLMPTKLILLIPSLHSDAQK